MASISVEEFKSLEPAIKAVLKTYNVKATLEVQNYNKIVVNIISSPIDFDLEYRTHRRVNVYHIGNSFKGVALDFLLELKAALMFGNHNNSDPMIDHIDVGWWVDINIGQWNQPYLLTAPAKKRPFDLRSR